MRRRGVIQFLAGAGIVTVGLASIAYIGGYRLNLTPSEPLGLWRIAALRRQVETGDLVFVCLPATTAFEEARQRGYLRLGLCAGGVAPLIKTVVALAGQRIEIADQVIIDGRALPASTVRKTDGEGRELLADPGGVVLPHHLFLHSSFASSYDSRYFGAVPDSGLLGLARPVLTLDP